MYHPLKAVNVHGRFNSSFPSVLTRVLIPISLQYGCTQHGNKAVKSFISRYQGILDQLFAQNTIIFLGPQTNLEQSGCHPSGGHVSPFFKSHLNSPHTLTHTRSCQSSWTEQVLTCVCVCVCVSVCVCLCLWSEERETETDASHSEMECGGHPG